MLLKSRPGRAGDNKPPRPQKKARPPREKIKLTKLQKLGIAILSVLIVCGIALVVLYASLINTQAAQEVSPRFSGASGLRFAQVTAFFEADKTRTPEQINTFRATIDPALKTAGEEEPSERERRWVDAYSASAKLTLTGEKGSIPVSVIGVGGDWFLFHPLRLLDGNYISEQDFMHDGVVIDRETAWKLFGSLEVAGMHFRIGDRPFKVAGVIDRETDRATVKSYKAGSGIFMHYDVLNELEKTPIGVYELCCREPITGFTEKLMKEGFAETMVVRNTGRFRPLPLLRVIGEFGGRSSDMHTLDLPYWENAARRLEDELALVMVLGIVVGIAPITVLCVLIIKAAKRGHKKLRDEILPKAVESIREKIRVRARARVLKKEAEDEAKYYK